MYVSIRGYIYKILLPSMSVMRWHYNPITKVCINQPLTDAFKLIMKKRSLNHDLKCQF